MKKLYSAVDLVTAGHLQSVLQDAGISCWIKNQVLSGAIGELPPTAVWPELWLHDERDYHRAQAIITKILDPGGNQSTWRCRCGELLEGQFEVCWSCGAERPD